MTIFIERGSSDFPPRPGWCSYTYTISQYYVPTVPSFPYISASSPEYLLESLRYLVSHSQTAGVVYHRHTAGHTVQPWRYAELDWWPYDSIASLNGDLLQTNSCPHRSDPPSSPVLDFCASVSGVSPSVTGVCPSVSVSVPQ